MSDRWDRRFMDLAKHIAGWSKDPSTQVGAVIVNRDRVVIGMGYNGFPRGVLDDPEMLEDRPTKYARTVHAEMNAVLNAVVKPVGATLFVTSPPCAGCTTVILQAGIKRVVHPTITPEFEKRWGDSLKHSRIMLAQANVIIDCIGK